MFARALSREQTDQAGKGTKLTAFALCLVALLAMSAVHAASAWARSSGALAWGSNSAGQLGNGTTNPSDVPVAVNLSLPPGVTVASVSAGSNHSLALLSDGTVRAWGANEVGQLGDGTSGESETLPVAVSGLTDVIAVSAGGEYSLALLGNGTVMAWGANSFGQLGDHTSTGPEQCGERAAPCSTTPTEVHKLEEVTAVSAGAYHSLALLSNGTVVAWGYNNGALGDGMAAGPDRCEFAEPCSTTPVSVSGLHGVTAIAAGEQSLALLSNSTVMAWGSNFFGELGDGTSAGPEQCEFSEPCSTTPVPVSGLSDVTAVAAGVGHSLALTGDGAVMAWGANYLGQLGDGNLTGPEQCGERAFPCSTTPTAVTGLGGVTAIAAGLDHSLALLSDGTVNAWGANFSGQLGDGTSTGPEGCEEGGTAPCSATPVAVSGLTGVAAIAAGGFSLAYSPPSPSPPTAVTETASSVGEEDAVLNGTVNPNGEAVSDCHFEYGTTETYGSEAACAELPGSGESPIAVRAKVEPLHPGTTYHFRVVATNPDGTGYGKDGSFKTLPVKEPPKLPLVETGEHAEANQTSAFLSGRVNPNGRNVSDCRFEYGSGEKYEFKAPCSQLPGSGESFVEVHTSVTGLSANTTYRYRIVATNTDGTSTGADESFKTLPTKPPVVKTDAPLEVNQTSAFLYGRVNPNGRNVSDCHFEYGSSEKYGFEAPCSQLPGSGESFVEVHKPVMGLSANTTYHYRIVATNTDGTSKGADESFKTLPNPPAVETEAASQIAPTSAKLNASVNPNGAASSCHFDYGTTESYGSSAPCTSAPGSGETPVVVSAQIAELSPGTTYHVRVVATNRGGTSYGGDEVFTTLASSASGTSNEPSTPAEASDGPVSATASGGTGTVTVGQYASNPVGSPAFKSSGAYIDTYLAPGSSFTKVEFTDCELNGGTSLYWWNPQANEGSGEWQAVSDQTAPSGTPPCITVTVTKGTRPSLSDMTGTVFGVAVPAAPPPTIKKLSPKKGPAAGGTAVTITGSGFAGVSAVKFGSADATDVTYNSATSVTAVAPPGTTGLVDVRVQTPNGTSPTTSKDGFTFERPTVTGVSPNMGSRAGGTAVTVTGSGFAPGSGTSVFKFGKSAASVVECSSTTECTMVSPAIAKAAPVDVRATVSKKTSSKTAADRFAYD